MARALASVTEPRLKREGTGKWDRTTRAAPLNELFMGDNAFGDEGGVPLVTAAASMQGITWLNLSGCPAIGDETLLCLAKLLADKSKFRKLKELRLVGSGARGGAKAALAKACKERGVGCML